VNKVSATLELSERVTRLRAEGSFAYSLSTPVFDEMAHLIRNYHDEVVWSTKLPPAQGDELLRTAFADTLFSHYRRSREHEVVITAGAKAGLFAILQGVCQPGSAVIIISPHWPSYDTTVNSAGLRAVHFETCFSSDFRVLEAEFEQFLSRLGAPVGGIVIANPNNPTGRVHDASEIKMLARIAGTLEVPLVLDESFSEIMFEKSKWSQRPTDIGRNVYVVNSLSKNFHLQGLRVGACLVPNHTVQRVTNAHQAINSAASSVSQAVAGFILNNKERLGLRPKDMKRQRDLMWRFINENRWDCRDVEGTFYFFPKVGDADGWARFAEERNVFVLKGDVFGERYGEHVRLCFAHPLEQLSDGLKRLNG